MDPISNAARLVLILRQKLEARAKAGAAARARTKAGGPAPAEPTAIRALASVDGGDERPLRRAVIQNLLGDQLGPGLINDAQFQQVVSRVCEAIEEDEVTAGLLTRVIGEIREG